MSSPSTLTVKLSAKCFICKKSCDSDSNKDFAIGCVGSNGFFGVHSDSCKFKSGKKPAHIECVEKSGMILFGGEGRVSMPVIGIPKFLSKYIHYVSKECMDADCQPEDEYDECF